jgi:DNA modification methylase
MGNPKPSALVDTRVIYCGDNLEQLQKLPDACVDLIYIDPPFNSNRNYEVFWGETKEKRAFEDRHESTRAYIDYMRPRCQQLHRVLKPTGSFYHHCHGYTPFSHQNVSVPNQEGWNPWKSSFA